MYVLGVRAPDIDTHTYVHLQNETTINVLLSSAEPISRRYLLIHLIVRRVSLLLNTYVHSAQAAFSAARRSRKLLCLERYLRIMD
jgi:hypothetical protein